MPSRISVSAPKCSCSFSTSGASAGPRGTWPISGRRSVGMSMMPYSRPSFCNGNIRPPGRSVRSARSSNGILANVLRSESICSNFASVKCFAISDARSCRKSSTIASTATASAISNSDVSRQNRVFGIALKVIRQLSRLGLSLIRHENVTTSPYGLDVTGFSSVGFYQLT